MASRISRPDASAVAKRYLHLMRRAIREGRAHLCNNQGGMPADPSLWGWLDGSPGGRKLGWLIGADVFIDPQQLHRSMPKLCLQMDEDLPPQSRAEMQSAFRSSGFLTRCLSQTALMRQIVEGSRRYVLAFRAVDILAFDPAPAAAPSAATDEQLKNGTPQWNGPVDYPVRGGTDASYKSVPRGPSMSKKDIYDWKIEDEPGVFARLPKASLHVDHDYQRRSINHARVRRIASKWSWLKLGVLTVVRREDGSLFVVDGQHRKLGADLRSDIGDLPCLVFEISRINEEARAFLSINADRSSVRATDSFHAKVAARDGAAIQLLDIFKAHNYTFSTEKAGRNVQRSVSTLLAAVEWDAKATGAIFGICVGLVDQHSVPDGLFKALVTLERHLRSQVPPLTLTEGRLREVIVEAGVERIEKAIEKGKEYNGNNPTAAADGILKFVINLRRNRHRIPQIY